MKCDAIGASAACAGLECSSGRRLDPAVNDVGTERFFDEVDAPLRMASTAIAISPFAEVTKTGAGQFSDAQPLQHIDPERSVVRTSRNMQIDVQAFACDSSEAPSAKQMTS